AADCKSVYTGSIPVLASILIPIINLGCARGIDCIANFGFSTDAAVQSPNLSALATTKPSLNLLELLVIQRDWQCPP
ncbi:MAG: hypothetical protein ACWA5A_08055, partial [Marinibacterium sp.]